MMKTTMAVLWTLFCAAVLAQTAPIIPVEREPFHRAVFEDARIRVLEIRIPAGSESLMHNHRHDGVHVTVQGARISETTPRGWWASTHEASAPGLTYYSALNGKEYAHQIKNIDTVGTHIIAVELLGPAATPARAVAGLPYTERIASNARVDLGRIKLAQGARAALPALPEPVLLVSLSAGVANAGQEQMELKPGSLHWLSAGPARDLAAPAGADLEVIAIQFR